MRKYILLLFAFGISIYSLSEPITRQQAFDKAKTFFAKHGKRVQAKDNSAFHAPKAKDGNAAYYVFNANDNEGYVIVSGDDRTQPVIGYSLQGSLTNDDMPCNMRAWLDECQRQIEYIQKNNIKVRHKISSSDHETIEPMLTTKWSQLKPYNNLCPKVDTIETVTGCVATAMAQVLYYQYLQHPSTITKVLTVDIPAYESMGMWTNRPINLPSIPAGAEIDWDNMLPEYGDNASDTQKNAVASFMLYCGESVKMNYGPASEGGSATSATRVPDALVKYFGFDKSCSRIARSLQTTDEWNDVVYNELANNRVVQYSGRTATGDGHSFVIDGYAGEGYFHVNWGWGGLSDGNFMLSLLSPDEKDPTATASVEEGYNYDQEIVVNAIPDEGGVARVKAEAFNYSQDGNTLKYNLLSRDNNEQTYDYGFGYIDDNGEIVPAGETLTVTLNRNAYYPNVYATLDLTTLADGTYDIVPMAKLSTENEWQTLWGGHKLSITIMGGQVITGIATVNTKKSATLPVFNIQGMKVADKECMVSPKPGIYIINGRKTLKY